MTANEEIGPLKPGARPKRESQFWSPGAADASWAEVTATMASAWNNPLIFTVRDYAIWQVWKEESRSSAVQHKLPMLRERLAHQAGQITLQFLQLAIVIQGFCWEALRCN